jgi:hypothetical protein
LTSALLFWRGLYFDLQLAGRIVKALSPLSVTDCS